MRNGVFLAITLMASGLATATLAATEEKAKAGKDAGTQHSFEEVLVQGKYHFSDEAVTTVEEDKVLDALIGARTDFKGRLLEAAEQF